MSYGRTTPEPPQRPGLSSAAIVIAVLALVVVLGIIGGVAVIAIGGIGPLGRTTASGPPSDPVGPSGSPGVPTTVPAPPDSPAPPVTAANLPTSGDLVWPGSQWHVVDTVAAAGADPVAPCQTWSAQAPPTQTAIQGRSYRLGDGVGAGFAYVISYPGEADAATVAEALIADGMSCAERLGGEQGPRMTVSGPLGSGVFTDLTWTGEDGDRVGTWGVARAGSRVVWLWMAADGGGADWLGRAEDHPMAASLTHALRRLRTGM